MYNTNKQINSMASDSKTVHGITNSIRKMTISPKKAAMHKIIANPGKYIAAFNILLRAWIRANILSIDHTLALICDELLSYEMPPDFMVWYFDKRRTVAKFNKFNMFREQHGDKIKATAVIQQSHLSVPVATGTYRPDMSAIAAADAFGPPPAREGGRKKRTQHRRMRRTRIIRTRRHRGQNRKSRK